MPIDDIEILLRSYFINIGRSARSKVFEGHTQTQDLFAQAVSPALGRVRDLSRTRTDGRKFFPNAEPAASPQDLLAFTAYSLSDSDNARLQARFDRPISRPDCPGLTQGTYLFASVLADPMGRNIMNAELGRLENARTEDLARRMDRAKGAPLKADVFLGGLSTHASNFATVFRFLRPDAYVVGADRYDAPGRLWLDRSWMPQNNTAGPRVLGGGNLPRQGGDLFPLGDFGAMSTSYLATGRWPFGDDAGTAIRWNLGYALDDMLCNHEVVGIERAYLRSSPPSSFYVTLKGKDGKERVLETGAAFFTGARKERNPFRDSAGRRGDIISARIWDEELEKARNGKDALVYTFDAVSARLQTRAGVEQLLCARDNVPKVIGVGGAGDGGRSLEVFLQGAGWNPRAYMGLTPQITGPLPNSIWFGQKAKTAQEFVAGYVVGGQEVLGARCIYAPAAAGLPKVEGEKSRVTPEPREIDALRRTQDGRLAVYVREADGFRITKPYVVDTLFMSNGFDPDLSVFEGLRSARGDIPRDAVYGIDNRPVYAAVGSETNVGLLGPSAGFTPRSIGTDVARVFADLGIAENEVADWVLGWVSQRAAFQFASTYPQSNLRQAELSRRPNIYDPGF